MYDAEYLYLGYRVSHPENQQAQLTTDPAVGHPA